MKLLLGVLFLWLLSSEGNADDLEEYGELEALRRLQFSCEQVVFPETPSSSVHALRPADIKAVTSIGSLQRTPESGEDLLRSTGKNFLEVSMATLAALISTFNPSVLHLSPPPGTAGATPGSQARDLLHQAEEIVELMKENQMTDFQNDWKLITVFFSAETPCSSYAPTQLKDCISENLEKLTAVLDFLYEKVPKAFVNLVDSTELTTASLSCQNYSNVSNPGRNQLSCSALGDNILRWSYQDALEKLLESESFDQKDDFTVVLQPSLQERNLLLRLGKDGLITTSKTEVEILEDYLFVAVGLWNNMMQPVGQKQPYGVTKIVQVQCPSQENPYLFTYRNSNYSSSLRTSNTKETSQERSYGTNIPCSDRVPSDTVPVSVHNLKPADIRVIAGLGDSLTAGNGAGSKPHDVLDVLTQYRGLSWSVGGNENISTVTTLPNILREFNPSLVGYSIGTGRENSKNAAFNQAVAGARADGVPEQVRKLVDLMKNDSRINFQNDWKLITLFIGGNDLCKHCEDPVHHSPENYTYNLQIALDLLHKEVPRAYVNLVTLLSIESLRELHASENNSCPKVLMRMLCPCVISPKDNSTELKKLIYFNRKYQERTRQLVESGRYDTKDDFTVVIQPFMTNMEMPKTQEGSPDSSYFAPDCFHFSQKAHSQVARALWNNMLEPVGEKTDSQPIEDEIVLKCPSEAQPFLRTYKNSNYTYPNQTPNYGSQLLCEDRSPSSPPAASVHSLKPADVKIVAALGDSLTAGSGIASDTLQDVTTQYRGLSWSIGGDESLENVTTLPNIFRKFNVKIMGYSTGTGSENDSNAFLNQAVPGAQAEHLPAQARNLVRLMKTDQRIDFSADWKLITVHIGGNDLCNYCKDPVHYSAGNYIKRIQETLDILHKEVPKALVSLVDVMDILPLRQLFVDTPVQCPTYLADNLCSCVLTGEENSENLTMVRDATKAYQLGVQRLIESGRYDTHENFTVVIQPFLQNLETSLDQDGNPDVSYFAPDCFHPSQKGHSQLAKALWNAVLQPVGQKANSFDFSADIILGCPAQNSPFLGTYKNSNYTPVEPTREPIENWGSELSCPGHTPSSRVPTSVHELRPADIKAIGALGDSLTTAVGAKVPDLQTDWRGLSWSIGGDETLEIQATLPNILKKFNPNLFGFSSGSSKETAGFNVAERNATARDMPAQARALVELMRSSSKINFKEDWKLITVLVGGSDLCQYCLDKETYSVQKYIKHLQDTLDIFYKELPRVFINMVEMLEFSGLRQITASSSECALRAKKVCPCFLNPEENSSELQEIKRVNRDFQAEALQLINSGRYEQREDFAVVMQPFFRNTLLPLDSTSKPDMSFFAADCFHFSVRGYAEMAMALWNNMLEPVGEKQTYNNFTHDRSKLRCPNPEKPFLSTRRNSGFGNSDLSLEKTESSVPYWAVIVTAVAGVLVGSLLGWVVSRRRTKKRQRKADTENNLKTTPL
ncbi:phospholipase B1, membrane-associated isoform X1 [Corvus cornix cornix]|uniref:phospholipase B1, membrane-associated isoform X1 n=1 Tax=Corvus cornix cornix TaxID=932674 RepID=UPI0009ACD656|nr:phospholipase B1, membrane-associated isoform X1 [Corvus cornix cornix]